MTDSGEVETSAKERLCKSDYAELNQVVCQYDKRRGTLTLRGNVSCFYWKQMAQEVVRRVKDVERVINCIEVRDT